MVFEGSIHSNIYITKEVNIQNNIQKNNIQLNSQNIFFAISKLFYNNKIKLAIQSIELNSLSENDNIFQEGEVVLKKNPILGLPEVSKLIGSVMTKRQGHRRKQSLLEKKKILHKRENGFSMNTQKYHTN